MLFYPCISDSNGNIRIKTTTKPMTHSQASDFLKKNYPKQWLNCEAIPQSENINQSYLIYP